MIGLVNVGVEVLWVARFDFEVGYELKEHQHKFYQLMYIIDGDGSFYLEDGSYPIHPGNLFLIKSDRLHSLKVNKSAVKTYDVKFFILDDELKRIVDGLDDYIPVHSGDIPDRMKSILKEGTRRSPYYQSFCDAYLLQILITLIRLEGSKADYDTTVIKSINLENDEDKSAAGKVLSCIHNHYFEELTLEDIAQYVGYNKSYICQIFKRAFEYTPMRYLYMHRIKIAKELILHTSYSLNYIARDVGFKDVHHFSQRFHELEGVSPGKWRDKQKEGIGKGIYINSNDVVIDYVKRS